MSCIVLDFEPADMNDIRNWEFLFMAKLRDTPFVLQRSTNPQSKHFGVQDNCTEMCETLGVWNTMFSNIAPRDVNGEYFAKRTE